MTKNTNKKTFIVSLLVLFVYVFVFMGSTFAWFTDEAKTNISQINAGDLAVDLQMKNSSGTFETAVGDGKSLSFYTLDGVAIDSDTTYWAPGVMYQLPAVKVVNSGDLAIYYNLTIGDIAGNYTYTDSETGETKLLPEVIEVFIKEKDQTDDDYSEFKSIGLLSDLMTNTDGFDSGILLPTGETIDSTAPADEQAITRVYESKEYIIAFSMLETAGNEYKNLSIDSLSLKVNAKQYKQYQYDKAQNN